MNRAIMSKSPGKPLRLYPSPAHRFRLSGYWTCRLVMVACMGASWHASWLPTEVILTVVSCSTLPGKNTDKVRHSAGSSSETRPVLVRSGPGFVQLQRSVDASPRLAEVQIPRVWNDSSVWCPASFPAIQSRISVFRHLFLGLEEGCLFSSDIPRRFPHVFLSPASTSLTHPVSVAATNETSCVPHRVEPLQPVCFPQFISYLMADPSPPENQLSLAPGESVPDRSQPESSTKANTRPSARGTAFYQRKRAVRACQVCRARRTKCDNLKPSCSFCLKVGATCIQSPVDLSSFDPASLKILERLDDLEELMRSVSVEGSSNKTRVVEAPAEPRLEIPPPVGPSIQLGMIIPPGPEEVMSWHVFQTMRGEAAENDGVLHVDHVTAAASSPASVLGALDMEPRRVNDLLDSFFSYAHVKNPILDETATRKMVSTTIMNGIDWSAESCLSLLIFALGSIATPFGPSHETMPGTLAHGNAQSFFQAAQKRLGVLLSSDDIIAAQCLFLSGVYMMCIFQPVKAWRYFVQALASCQQLPFLTPESQQRYHTYVESGNELHNHPLTHSSKPSTGRPGSPSGR